MNDAFKIDDSKEARRDCSAGNETESDDAKE